MSRAHSSFALCLVGLSLAACTFSPAAEPPEGPPNTDIYIADMSTIGQSISIGQPNPVAAQPGYENQPAFTADGRTLLYTAAGPSGKTDLWARNLTSGEKRSLTQTPGKSEYSPRLASDGVTLSFIQEDPSGEVTTLEALTLGRSNAAPLIALKPLGYYAYLNNGEEVLTFFRSEPATLVHVDIKSGETREIASNIGRALYAAPNGTSAYFTISTSEDNFELHQYDAATGETRHLFALPEGAQDYTAFVIPDTPFTTFLAASGTDIFFRVDHPENHKWVKVADLSDAPFTDITRMAVNKTATRIAFVTERRQSEADE